MYAVKKNYAIVLDKSNICHFEEGQRFSPDAVIYCNQIHSIPFPRTGSDEEKKLLDRHWPKLLGLLHTDILALNSDVRKYESKEVHPTNEAMHELLAMLNTADQILFKILVAYFNI